ncbi:MAG: hypothetical protein JF606_05140 [Burkholderiales bacterium]|jgi:hypothetical protein|nr:hypothetical protein [Burkholderiales bacterium]
MSTVTFIMAAFAFAAGLVVQWSILRTMYRATLAKQCARHKESQRTMNDRLVQARRQVNHLQHDLAAARLQSKRPRTDDVGQSLDNSAHAKQAQSLDEGSPQNRSQKHGYADSLLF